MSLLAEARAQIDARWDIEELQDNAFQVSTSREYLCVLCKNSMGGWGWTINMVPPDESPLFKFDSPGRAFEDYMVFRNSLK